MTLLLLLRSGGNPPVNLSASGGAATAGGGTASLAVNLTATGGAATPGGGTANLTVTVTAASGLATAGGSATTLAVTTTATNGVATFGGGTATFTKVYPFTATNGVATFGGSSSTLTFTITAASGAATFGGGTASVTGALTATGGVATFGGGTVTFTKVYVLTATGGAATFGGNVTLSFTVTAASGLATAAGGTATLATALTGAGGLATAGGGTAALTVTLAATGGVATYQGGDASIGEIVAAYRPRRGLRVPALIRARFARRRLKQPAFLPRTVFRDVTTTQLYAVGAPTGAATFTGSTPTVAVALSVTGAVSSAVDTFTDTDGTTVEAHNEGLTWTSHPSYTASALIASNRAHFNAGLRGYYSSWVPPGAEYEVTATVRCVSNTGNGGPAGRVDTTANSMYGARWVASTGWELYKIVAGTVTVLGTYASDLPSAGQERTVRLVITDAEKSLWVDGVQRVTSADNAVTAAGRTGFRGNLGSSSTGFHLDNLTASYVAAGAATYGGGDATASAVTVAVRVRRGVRWVPQQRARFARRRIKQPRITPRAFSLVTSLDLSALGGQATFGGTDSVAAPLVFRARSRRLLRVVPPVRARLARRRLKQPRFLPFGAFDLSTAVNLSALGGQATFTGGDATLGVPVVPTRIKRTLRVFPSQRFKRLRRRIKQPRFLPVRTVAELQPTSFVASAGEADFVGGTVSLTTTEPLTYLGRVLRNTAPWKRQLLRRRRARPLFKRRRATVGAPPLNLTASSGAAATFAGGTSNVTLALTGAGGAAGFAGGGVFVGVGTPPVDHPATGGDVREFHRGGVFDDGATGGVPREPVRSGRPLKPTRNGTVRPTRRGGVVLERQRGGTVIQGDTPSVVDLTGGVVNDGPSSGVVNANATGGTVRVFAHGGRVRNQAHSGVPRSTKRGGTVITRRRGGTVRAHPRGGTHDQASTGGTVL